MVLAHGLYHGVGPEPAAACDLWRVDGGKIVEHWDAQQPWVAANPSGHSMTDGAIDVVDRDKTAVNKRLVEDFVELIMMGPTVRSSRGSSTATRSHNTIP